MQSPANLGSALEELLTSYHELNSSWVETVDGAPTPVQFLRYVQRNQPVVFKGAVGNWEAMGKWKVEYLKMRMGEGEVNVAMTPLGWVWSFWVNWYSADCGW